jgi:hypothetical protein
MAARTLVGGAHTRLTNTARIGTNWLVPSFLVRTALERDVPNFLKSLRAEIERPTIKRSMSVGPTQDLMHMLISFSWFSTALLMVRSRQSHTAP